MRARVLPAIVLAFLLIGPVALAVPTIVLGNSCPDGYTLVANGDLPVEAPPAGADLNRNGFQCEAQQGRVLLLTDDVPENVDIGQCGDAFSPVISEPGDVVLTAKDRNGDGIVCIRVTEVLQANFLEIFIIHDN